MAISAIGSLLGAAGLAPAQQAQQVQQVAAPDASAATSAPSGASGNTFTDALDNMQAAQNNADSLAVQAATGNLSDIHAYTIAATEASLTTELTVAVRNRAVESFNEIMRMQT
jgi:flagellar hook-basal body complex protein FliE